MRLLLCACLFVVACKGDESKPATPDPSQLPVTKVERPRTTPRPSLPDMDDANDPSDRADEGRVRPRLPEEQPRDWTDPDVQEEMLQRREERRKAREAALDTNKDGVVSPEERQQRLAPLLDRFDQDGDGKLTPDELATSNRRMGFDDPAALDTDHDGFISLAELDVAVSERRQKMRAKWRGRHGGSAIGVGRDEP